MIYLHKIQLTKISDDLIKLAKSCSETVNNVVISELIQRGDGFNNKALNVNNCLRGICKANNIPLITHNNILSHKHLNGSNLHLNFKGSNILMSNFISFITS